MRRRRSNDGRFCKNYAQPSWLLRRSRQPPGARNYELLLRLTEEDGGRNPWGPDRSCRAANALPR